jgi:hypothetical protein
MKPETPKQLSVETVDGWFINPIGYKVTLEEIVEEAEASFTNFVVNQLNDEYKNLTIDGGEMREYTKEHGFNAESLIKHIREKYADEDGATLQQIMTTAKKLIPYHGRIGKRIETPDYLDRIGDTGFELRISGYEYERRTSVQSFLKLIDIVLRGAPPSEVDSKEVETGKVYKDDKVKSLRYFKNNALKVIFYNADDCEKVKTALFMED